MLIYKLEIICLCAQYYEKKEGMEVMKSRVVVVGRDQLLILGSIQSVSMTSTQYDE